MSLFTQVCLLSQHPTLSTEAHGELYSHGHLHSPVKWRTANPTRKWACIPGITLDSSHPAWTSHMESSWTFKLASWRTAQNCPAGKSAQDQTQLWELLLHYYTAPNTSTASELRAGIRLKCCFLAEQASSHSHWKSWDGAMGSAAFSANARSWNLTIKTSSLKCWDTNVLNTLLCFQNRISHLAQSHLNLLKCIGGQS